MLRKEGLIYNNAKSSSQIKVWSLDISALRNTGTMLLRNSHFYEIVKNIIFNKSVFKKIIFNKSRLTFIGNCYWLHIFSDFIIRIGTNKCAKTLIKELTVKKLLKVAR